MQREVRRRDGDDLDAEREVTHVLLFRWRFQAERAVRFLAQSRSVRLHRSNVRPRWIVETFADDDFTDASVEHSLTYVLMVAEMFRGAYDGFGAPVVRRG